MGTIDTTFSDSGPGMAATTLHTCGWLDLAHNGIDISAPLKTGTRRATVELAPLRGGPAPGAGGRVCAFADDVVPGQRLLLEYRSRDGWDQGMPQRGTGWVVAHLTGPEDRSRMSLQIGAVEAAPGETVVTSKGAVKLSVGAASASAVTLTAEVMAAVPVDRATPVVDSWGPNRLDIFGRGLDQAAFHKAWANAWHPSPATWEALGGGFTSPLAVSSWGPERLDIFALGLDGSMWHKAWAQGWFPSQEGWEPLGGKFLASPAVASWGPGRIDIFGIGLDGAMYHKAWADGWFPSPTGWELLGGIFASPPAVVAWGPERLDIFAVGKDFGVWHKAWAQRWHPSQNDWEPLGGGFI